MGVVLLVMMMVLLLLLLLLMWLMCRVTDSGVGQGRRHAGLLAMSRGSSGTTSRRRWVLNLVLVQLLMILLAPVFDLTLRRRGEGRKSPDRAVLL